MAQASVQQEDMAVPHGDLPIYVKTVFAKVSFQILTTLFPHKMFTNSGQQLAYQFMASGNAKWSTFDYFLAQLLQEQVIKYFCPI